MRRFVVIALVIAFSMGIIPNAYASNQEITVQVNGKQVQSDVSPINVDGSVMLPFRAILNAVGVNDNEIVWREKSKSMEIKHNNKYVFLVIGSRGAVVDDTMIMLNAVPFIQQNRTMIPIRFISEVFGAEVQWNGDTNTVGIKMKK